MKGPPGQLTRYENATGRALAERYESIDPDEIHGWFADHLPPPPAAVLDVGAGSGRDASWFAAKGYEVVAVDPSATMLAEARRRHPTPRVTWFRDCLPSLGRTVERGLSYDVILLNAVWMHVHPDERQRAFRKLVGMLKPGGLIIFALRVGGNDADDGMFPSSAAEVESLARRYGAMALPGNTRPDSLGRPGIHWEQVALQLPDDGTGALPLLRHIILNDRKSSTYKLGLLRAVARAADSAPGMARHPNDDSVTVPLGLVALNWLRLYKSLVEAGLPQRPGKDGVTNLGFVKKGWRAIGDLPAFDLRVGQYFSGAHARGLHQALRDAVGTLVTMPIHYMTLPGSDEQVFEAHTARVGTAPGSVLVDRDYLAQFGDLRIPLHLWNSLMRHDAWIEPALISEWMKLMTDWATTRGNELDHRRVEAAMQWSDPDRDVGFARRVSQELFEEGSLHCVWTGRKLDRKQINIDHCMPWAAWPCDALWNLLPTDRRVNQHQKRARLPSADALDDARDRICTWWQKGYVQRASDRFFAEARSSLMLDPSGVADADKVFEGLQGRRQMLRTEHRIEEWAPP
ncbi:MAG: methyltransferase domain-containing protein [Alphaproteobacteria bacterium]|nr:methyltransferase domain-containing protein [Alphaproteobacteria bacterium]